ncbi:MAG: LysR substrate-binding domain-containing protein [Bacteroidia bacterium]
MNISGITRHQLNGLQALLRHGSFGAASEAMLISQPALSMQIQKLETQCGFPLVDRGAKPLALTPMGESFMAQAKLVLQAFHDLDDTLMDLQSRMEGELRLGVIPTIAPYYIPKVVGPFLQAYPNVQLQVRELTTERILAALRAGDIDLGVLAIPMAQDYQAFEVQELFQEPLWIYHQGEQALESMPYVGLAELENYNAFLLNEGHCLRDHVLMICGPRSLNQREGLQYQSGSLEALINLVDRYGGLTVIPEMVRQGLTPDQQGRTLPFGQDQAHRSIAIIHNKSGYKRRLVSAFYRICSLENQELEKK